MDYGDYYWGLYRDCYRDPFPHSLLRTRQFRVLRVPLKGSIGVPLKGSIWVPLKGQAPPLFARAPRAPRSRSLSWSRAPPRAARLLPPPSGPFVAWVLVKGFN